jgi:hypothetical protein
MGAQHVCLDGAATLIVDFAALDRLVDCGKQENDTGQSQHYVGDRGTLRIHLSILGCGMSGDRAE